VASLPKSRAIIRQVSIVQNVVISRSTDHQNAHLRTCFGIEVESESGSSFVRTLAQYILPDTDRGPYIVKSIYWPSAVVRSSVIWWENRLPLLSYGRSKLSKNWKILSVCLSTGSLRTVDAVFSNWCWPTLRSVWTLWYPTMSVKMEVDSCSMRTTPHTKHGVPVRFSQNSEK
jgi:hypothetical protein